MSSKRRKRKGDPDEDLDWKTKEAKSGPSEGICIIHMKESKKAGFTYLSSKTKDSITLKLKEIAEKRLREDRSSVHRMEHVCESFLSSIESLSEDTHGYHRECYQRFTSNLNRLTSASTAEPEKVLKRSERKSGETENIIFKPDCIFCNKEGKVSIKKGRCKTTEGLSFFDRNGGPKILDHAEQIKDTKLLTRIRGYNLFSCEAKYHRSCRERFLNRKRDPSSWRSDDPESCSAQAELEKVHKEAFQKVQNVIELEVIEKQEIMRFSTILAVYRDALKGTNFENDKYRAWKLKKKISNDHHLSSKIAFCTPKRDSTQLDSYLVYSQAMKIEDAVRASFELGISVTDKIKESAIEIRHQIIQAFKTHCQSQEWPPKADSQLDFQQLMPNSLQSFMRVLLTGSAQNKSENASRLMFSISQDICRAATRGKWNLPKHILLGMTMRHLFRSAELTVILNRFGHVPDYCFLLELESALAKSLDESSHLLTTNIIRNPSCVSVFHSDFDNFDQYTNELTGAGSVHRAHGIMMQELLPADGESYGGNVPELQPQEKTGERSYKFKYTRPPEDNLYMGIRKNPPMHVETTCIPGGEGEQQLMLIESFTWILLRIVTTEKGPQEYPGWSGFISMLGSTPSRLTTIDYYPVIPYPITEYSTIKETLRFAEEGSKEVGQEYHLVTYDLGVCIKAYPLIWNHPSKYKKHIVLIGTFHIVCAYMKMVGKKMAGSGFSDILIESGLMTSGSMEGVLSGKGYSRAMNCHKALLEGLERLLMSKFLDDINQDLMKPSIDRAKAMIWMHKTTPNSDLKTIVADEDVRAVVLAYQLFRGEVKSGVLGPTAKLWISYMDHVWLILSLLHSVKTNNYLEYAYCMTLLPDLFFAFGGQNYARYLTYFSVFLANIDHSHPGAKQLIKNGVFSVARSFVPGSRSATDKTIEETFMKHSKSRGGGCGSGMIGILNNQDAYQRWVKTAQERVKYYQATLQMAGMGPDNTKTNNSHKETRPSEITKSAQFVMQVVETIQDYSNPFDIADETNLYCLSSGCPVVTDTMEDVLRAEDEGKKAKEDFIKDRLGKENEGKKGKNGDGVFFDTIPRMKLKTMATDKNKVTLKKSDQSIVKYRQEGSFVFNLLVQLEKMDPNLVNLKDFVSYPLTPIPYSIGTIDGCLAKTNKSKGFHWLIRNVVNAKYPSEQTTVIEDGNAVFHCLTNVPNTFAEIAERVFEMASSCSSVVFSTDMYKADSVKSMERVRRGTSTKLLIGGPKTKKPADWKQFLKNNDNKKRFIEILLEVWSSNWFAPKLNGRDVTLICEGKAYKLTSTNSDGEVTKTVLAEIESDQEETDTRVVLYCFHAKSNGYKNVVVRTPDSDLFFILLSYIHDLDGITVYFETGKKNKKRLINLTELGNHYSDEYCKALLGLHAFTGCDSASAFKGKGKVKAIKLMLKDDQALKAAAALGNDWTLSEDVIDGLQRLTCQLYGMRRIDNVNTCRYMKLTSVCCPDDLNAIHPTKKFDTAFIPPAYVSFVEHCKRANFEAAKWKRSHIQFPLIQRPYADNGWHLDENHILHPVWFTGSMLPQTVINELSSETIEEADAAEEEDDETVDDVDYSDFVAEMFTETDDEEEFEGFSDIEDC